MPLLSLVLVSMLSVEPPSASTEAPVIVVAPAPAPAPVPDWGPSSSVVVSTAAPVPPTPLTPPPPPQPPRRPSMGIGLYIGSAVAFGVGLGARVHQVDVAMDSCRRGGWADQEFGSLTRCFDYYDPPGMDQNDVFVGAAYGSSIVLNMIASGALGRHAAWQTVHGDRRFRNPVSRYAFGAIFTGLGIASIGAHYALIYTDARNPCTSWECNVQRRALWIAASDGGALMLNTGFGMFSWANNYRSNVAKYDRRRQLKWSVVPGSARASAGATATLRF